MKDNNKKSESLSKVVINWYPGHMARTLREIKHDLKLIDIVLIVLDARIPHSSLNKEVYELVKSKTVIMVFNKSDLAAIPSITEAQNKYKKDGCYTICTNSVTGEGIDKLKELIRTLGEKIKYGNKTSESFKKIKKVYRALVVGIPNVGKSSLINKLSGRNSAEVGNKPGITKRRQWLKVGQDIEIMDTPGLLSKNLNEDNRGERLAIVGTIKSEVIDEELIAHTLISILMSNDWYMSMFKARYNLDPDIDSLTEPKILEQVGRKRGALLKGDRVDTLKAARILLEDYRTGKIGKVNLE